MTTEEKIFKSDWEMQFGLYKGEIIWHLRSHPNLALKCLCQDFAKDVLTWNKNNDYRPPFLRFDDHELASYFITQELLEVFLNSKNKYISSIEVPLKALEDPSWLTNYPKLEKLHIDNFQIGNELYDFIKKNTNIKEIKVDRLSCSGDIDLITRSNQMYISGESLPLMYQDEDLVVETDAHDPKTINVKTYSIVNDLPEILNRLKKYSKIDTLTISDFEGCKLCFYHGLHGYDEIRYTDSIHPEDLKKICSIMEQEGYDFSHVQLSINNETYPDFYALKGLDEKYKFTIVYDKYCKTSYEDFLYMRDTIDYYKTLITAYRLSPLEKIMYAYDLMKSFRYNESEKRSSNSRNIPEIIKTGEIVCVGYSSFFKQLLSELGIEAESIDVVIKDEDKPTWHARNIVHVDDDKYGVHGDFAFDSTWDSYKELYKVSDGDGKEVIKQDLDDGDEIIEIIGRLPLYRYFLVPAKEYAEVFKSEDLPEMLTNEENDYHKRLYLEQQFEVEKPDLETFKQILYQVRLAEGYSKENVDKEIDDVIFVNEYICSNYTHIPFFGKQSKSSARLN
jgi:hypothetical protein